MSKDTDKKALKSGVWYTISNFAVKTIGFITTPIFTRLLTKNEFGQFSNYTSWQSIMGILVSMNLVATLISAKYDFRDKFDSYVLSMAAFDTISTLCWIAIINIFPNFFSKAFDMNIMYINAMLLYIMFSAIYNLFQSREQFLYRYKYNAILAVTNILFSTLVSLALVLILPNRLMGRIIGMVIPTIVLGAGLLAFIINKGKRVNFSYLSYALKICLPYVPHSLSLILLSSMDRIMITKICGSEQTALYGLAYTCGAAITILISSMNTAFAPWLGDQLDMENYNKVKKVSYYYICIFIYLAFGVMLIIPELLLVMGGKSYIDAKFVMAPISLGIIFQFLYTMFVNIEQFKKKTIGMAIATMTAAGSNYVLNAIFIPLFGYVAAAYTTAASYLLLLVIHMGIVKKMKFNNVYNYRFIGLIALLATSVCVFMQWVYTNTILRCIIFTVYLIVTFIICYRNKNKVKSIIKLFIGDRKKNV